ncbi:hypothetical protein BKA62DRAFT_721272 [Auriculariales sp. MPI-PUGE-AT-0066]|nr:hypothetical protein BKA62DRAFT_721272 [Auriculariales sp. MPI-PUGE-AT-0066]
MADLPPELLEAIFDSLNSNELVEMTRVCSHWRAVALDHENCCRYLTLSLDSRTSVRSALDSWHKRLKSVRDTAISISLTILILPYDEEHAHPPPSSLETAFRAISEIMQLVLRLVVVIHEAIPAKALLTALCASPAPRLRVFDIAFEACDFTWSPDLFARESPRLDRVNLSDTLPPRLALDAFGQVRTICMTRVSGPEIIAALSTAFPGLLALELYYCDLNHSSPPSSWTLRRLYINDLAQSDVAAKLATFDTRAIPRISVATRDELPAIPQPLLIGMDKARLSMDIFAWTVMLPFDEGEMLESEVTIADSHRQYRRDITSVGLNVYDTLAPLAQRLVHLTIAHTAIQQLTGAPIILQYLETLTITLRSFTVQNADFFDSTVSPTLTAPGLHLLVLHNGNGLAPDRERKGTRSVAVDSTQLARFARALQNDQRHTKLQLCGVQLTGSEESNRSCLALFAGNETLL